MLPETMTVIEAREPGGPEVLVPATRPVPKPGSDEVLIEVAAAGVNRPDVLQRMGLYPPPKGASDLLGLEVAGKIVARGEDARRFKEGDQVCALVNGGGYAEFAVAPEATTLPVPRGLSLEEVAALPDEYRFEPELGLIAGGDGLDLCLRILRDAPRHLEPGGLLIVEVGESEKALVELLPEVPFNWIEFNVGQMGVLLLDRDDLVEHAEKIRQAAKAR